MTHSTPARHRNAREPLRGLERNGAERDVHEADVYDGDLQRHRERNRGPQPVIDEEVLAWTPASERASRQLNNWANTSAVSLRARVVEVVRAFDEPSGKIDVHREQCDHGHREANFDDPAHMAASITRSVSRRGSRPIVSSVWIDTHRERGPESVMRLIQRI